MNPYKKTTISSSTLGVANSVPKSIEIAPAASLNSTVSVEKMPNKASSTNLPMKIAPTASSNAPASMLNHAIGGNTSNTKLNGDQKARMVTPSVSALSIKAQLKKQIAMLKKEDIVKGITVQSQILTKRNLDQAFSKNAEEALVKQRLRQEQKQALIKERMAKLEEKLQPKKALPPTISKEHMQTSGTIQTSEKVERQSENLIAQATTQTIDQSTTIMEPSVIPSEVNSTSTQTPQTQETDPTIQSSMNYAPMVVPWVPHYASYPQCFAPVAYHFMTPNLPTIHPNPYQFLTPMIPQFNHVPFAVPTPYVTNPIMFPQRPTAHLPIVKPITSHANKKKTNMLLHQQPMDSPSPYARSHIILPFEIQITKVKGQAFGLEIRFENQATFIMIEERVHVNTSAKEKGIETKTTSTISIDPINSDTTDGLLLKHPEIPPNIDSKNIHENGLSGFAEDERPVADLSELNQIHSQTIIEERGSLNINIDETEEQSVVCTLQNMETSPVQSHSGGFELNVDSERICCDSATPTCCVEPQHECVAAFASNVLTPASFYTQAHIGNSMADVTATTMTSETHVVDTESVSGNSINVKEAIPSVEEGTTLSSTNATISQTLSESITPGASNSEATVIRQRKKRSVYGVISVVNATKQNERATTIYKVPKDHTLQPGDIILNVDETDVCGLLFPQASALFSQCSTYIDADASSKEEEPVIICRLKVAREKRVVKILERLSSLSSQSAKMDAIARKAAEGAFGPIKPNEAFDAIPVMFRDFLCNVAQSIGIEIKSMAYQYLMMCDDRINNSASLFWEKIWAAEVLTLKAEDRGNFVRLTDSQRNRMRSLPKPLSGCKCGSSSHEFVDDIECPLYSDLRIYGSASFIPRKRANRTSVMGSVDPTGTIDTAHLERQRLMQERAEAEENEAKFVAEMESIQVNHLRKAIFAPRLSLTMLLSAIVHFSNQMSIKRPHDQISGSDADVNNDNGDDESDDDDDFEDDVPLTSLGVDRSSIISKPQYSRPSLSVLARLLRFISQVWGHVFQEPDPFTFAWYEESKRLGSNQSPIVRRNPRRTGLYTFESFRFILDDALIDRLSAQKPFTEVHLRDQFLIMYLVSNKKSGLLSDIMSLMKAGVVRIDDSSNIVLSPSWLENIPHLLLVDMWESGWLDVENKFCIPESLLQLIHSTWKRNEKGWVYGNSLKYRHDEFEERKSSFQVLYDERVNAVDGIGQFGV